MGGITAQNLDMDTVPTAIASRLGIKQNGIAPLYVDTEIGLVNGGGRSWSDACSTMARALSLVRTGGTIFFKGKVQEECTGSNLIFDVTICGVTNQGHHADYPSATATDYRYSERRSGASAWSPPASPTTATPLLIVRGRGWRLMNCLMDCPVDAAGVYLERNALSGTSEYDASHFSAENVRFESGLVGIQNAGGASFCRIKNCRFTRMSGSGAAGIKCTSTAVAIPLDWEIEDCKFFNNASHILSSMSYSTIRNNVFGRFTATLSIDLDDQPSANQGEYNIITRNYLGGTYGATAYPPGATGTNEWAGNNNVLSGGTTAADPT